MEQSIVDFTEYLRNEKKSSENTVLSYTRDLKGFCKFLKEAGIQDPAKVNRTNVMAYVYELQKQHKAGATVSRNIASIRSFFQFLLRKGVVMENPAADMELPKVEKKIPEILSLEKVELLLEQVLLRTLMREHLLMMMVFVELQMWKMSGAICLKC